MAKVLQLRGGTTSAHSTFTGALREVTVDTDKDTLVVHDGSTAGGFPLARQSSVDLKANLASPTFTGTVVLPSTTSIGNISNTELSYLDGVTSAIQTQLGAKANLASPTFTGTPLAPTASTGDSSTKIATTAFVNSEITNDVGVANSSLVKTALNASGSAPIYACRSWVNFNGTGTVAIRASGNVSSITDNGTGDYTVNFATAMEDVNYTMSSMGSNVAGQGNYNAMFVLEKLVAGALDRTSTALGIYTYGYNAQYIDGVSISIAIFR